MYPNYIPIRGETDHGDFALITHEDHDSYHKISPIWNFFQQFGCFEIVES